MGTEVGIFWMIVLIIVAVVFLLKILVFGAMLFFGAATGIPIALKELAKNWKKMDTSDKISYIGMIVLGIYIWIEILLRICL